MIIFDYYKDLSLTYKYLIVKNGTVYMCHKALLSGTQLESW